MTGWNKHTTVTYTPFPDPNRTTFNGKRNKEQVPVSEPWLQTLKHKTHIDVFIEDKVLMWHALKHGLKKKKQ